MERKIWQVSLLLTTVLFVAVSISTRSSGPLHIDVVVMLIAILWDRKVISIHLITRGRVCKTTCVRRTDGTE